MKKISIHALRAEGDGHRRLDMTPEEEFLSTPSVRRATGQADKFYSLIQFLSTPSVRRATEINRKVRANMDISIHALRAEGDRIPAR